MLANLISKNTRTRYDEKVVRLTFDIPYQEARTRVIEGEDLMEFLDIRVGSQVGLRIVPLDEERQERLGREI